MQRVLVLATAVAIGVGGFVHFRIWQHEYRHAPVRELFVANWVASALVVLLLVAASVRPSVTTVAALGALLVSVGSLAAFALSRGPGVPTLHGSFKETGLETTSSYFFQVGSAKTILVAEELAVLFSAVVAGTRRRGRRGGCRPLHRDQRSSSGGN